MGNRRTLLLVVAMLVAAMGTGLILMYVKGIDARATQGQELVRVLTATELIEPGETVADAQAAGKFAEAEVRRDDMVEGALSSAKSITDQVALTNIYPGEQLLGLKFGAAGSQAVLTIPDNLQAYSVQLTDPARVAGFVNAGSWVSVLYTTEPVKKLPDGKEVNMGSYAQVILDRVQVIGVGATTATTRTTKTEEGESTTEEIPRTILTLAVNQDQAEKLALAASTGELSFTLLNDESKSSVRPGIKLQNLIPDAFKEVPVQ